MDKREIWFTRFQGKLWVAISYPGAKFGAASQVSSVASVYLPLKTKGRKIVSVGIVPPEMLGLE